MSSKLEKSSLSENFFEYVVKKDMQLNCFDNLLAYAISSVICTMRHLQFQGENESTLSTVATDALQLNLVAEKQQCQGMPIEARGKRLFFIWKTISSCLPLDELGLSG